MKILFIPDERKSNPYQKALADSLSREGIHISFGTVFYLFSVLRLVKNYWKPDIIHLHWLDSFLLAGSTVKTILKSVSFIIELLILKLCGIRIVWTVHNIVNHEARFVCLELFFNKLIAQLSDKITVHSQSAKYKVMKAYRITKSSRIVVIPHGNYINSYENIVSKSETRNQLEIDIKDLVYLYFGRIKPYKGVPELINAFKELSISQVKLLIVGKPCGGEIVEKILSECSMDGNIKTVFECIPDNEIQIYMNAADVVVLPYRDILTSGAILLAMSFGKSIIAPAIGCIPDVLDRRGSFLYNPLEEDGLLKAMKQALSANLEKMGEHNFELAKQLRWDNIAKQIYKVYQECLRRQT